MTEWAYCQRQVSFFLFPDMAPLSGQEFLSSLASSSPPLSTMSSLDLTEAAYSSMLPQQNVKGMRHSSFDLPGDSLQVLSSEEYV